MTIVYLCFFCSHLRFIARPYIVSLRGFTLCHCKALHCVIARLHLVSLRGLTLCHCEALHCVIARLHFVSLRGHRPRQSSSLQSSSPQFRRLMNINRHFLATGNQLLAVIGLDLKCVRPAFNRHSEIHAWMAGL